MVTKEKAIMILISYAGGMLQGAARRNDIDRLQEPLAQVQRVLGAAASILRYASVDNTDQGWDGQFRGSYPDLITVVWGN